ncbi:MAG: alpha/beta hydrolase [Clostridia bacterium]|nr:alpha/beta hydrolase [Clostridia bacterium]
MAKTVTLPIKNGEVEIVRFGQGNKSFVILPGLSYDGFFEAAEEIERAYAAFAKDYTVYLVDRNKWPHEGYTVEEIADDTAEVFEQLKIEKADAFGASLGGMVAQALAIRHPKLVDRLVIGSTLARPNETFLSVLSRWKSLAKVGKIEDLITDFYHTIYCPATLRQYAAALDAARPIATEEKTRRFLIYVEAAKRFDSFDSLGRIKCKTLVVASRGDRVTTAEGAREIAEKLACDYYEYENFGHAVFDEAPDYKERILDHFLRK